MNEYGDAPAQQLVGPHREQHENGFDAIRLLKVAQRTPGAAGSVLYTDGASPAVVSWSINPYVSGAGRFGSATEPTNHAAGDVTVDGILSVATNAAPATGVKAQVTGAAVVSKWLRVGSLVVLTGATTDGDITGKRLFVEDVNFNLQIAAGAAGITFDSNDSLSYTRSSNTLTLTIGSTAVMSATAAALKHLGYASFIGVLTDPANTTAGDLTAKRGHFGTDGAFTANVELEVTGDFHVSGDITGAGWTSVVYAGANFTANAGATWTVQNADQVTFAYDKIRKTVTVALELGVTSITVATPTVLSIAIPFTAAKAMATLCYLIDNAVVAVGLMQVAAGGTAITVSRLDGAAFALSANLTYVQGTFTFEVQ